MGDNNLKKLFSQKSNQFLSGKDLTELGESVESSDYIASYAADRERYMPAVDFDKPENFARFGSAEDYYRESVERIYKTYPYDGSRAERVEFENSSSYLDRWILDTRYPKSTGYVNFNTAPDNTWAAPNSPHIKEYIHLYGGPGTGSIALAGKSLSEHFAGTNVYDTAKGRESNLKFDFDQGLTFECWAKMGDTDANNQNQTLFHLANDINDIPGHGSLWIYRKATGLFAKVYQPGGAVEESISLYTTAEGLPAALDSWKHYAFSFKNEGNDIRYKVYVDGVRVKNATHTPGVFPAPETTGSLRASIGATFQDLRTGPAPGALSGSAAGWMKMSGSIDEVRYWKAERTAEEIGRYWFTQVGGGTNSDDANTDLGVYYKFNEGITGDTSTDSTVLDYSGRVTNGVWVGYDSTYSRNTGSAIVLSSASTFERKDPIIYSSHPEVAALLSELKISGSAHDRRNNSSIYASIPSWITEEDDNSLKILTQIMSSYLDTLYLQIENLPRLKDTSYLHLSGSKFKPVPFAGDLLDSAGFVSPEMFVDADIFESFFNRTNDELFEEQLVDVKNSIYQNIYNNLVYIYKSKGTEKSFRNLIRCYGIGDDIVRLNIYADKSTYVYEDNFETTSQKKNVINFNKVDNFAASVYQSTSSLDSNSQAFISGTQNLSYVPRTIEANILFPKKRKVNEKGYFRTPFVSASLFGMHTSRTTSPENPTWASPDVGNFQVYAIKDKQESPSVRFKLTGTAGGGMPSLTTDLFEDVYDNQAWNISVRVKPTKYPTADFTDGSSETTYDVEFTGYNNVLGITYNTFHLTGTMTEEYGKSFLSSSHRVFVGSHATNFTGTVLERSDMHIGGIRYWMDYLEDEELVSHAKDFLNYGRKHPHRDAYPLISSVHRIRIPQKDTLALNWDFQQVTGSDASGLFLVDDYSSGSVSRADQMYGFMGPVLLDKHPGIGHNFPASDTNVVDVDYIYAARQALPENVVSSDMTQVLDNDDITFTRETRPIRHFFAFEKSMYDAVSQEMIAMFSTIKDFSNLVGNPVNRYRERYKDMEKLRSLFFDRVENTPNLDKYVEFYKWIDSSLGYMLNQLVPATADFADNVRNMVESHVLERNKYKTKFPTLDRKGAPPEGYLAELGGKVNDQLRGRFFPWHRGHAPPPNSPLDQNENCDWWRYRAERTQADISSSVASVNEGRTAILGVVSNTYNRETAAPYRYGVVRRRVIDTGINYSLDKIPGYAEAETNFGTSDSLVTVYSDSLLSSSCTDSLSLEKKVKVHAKATSTSVTDGIKADMATPFTLIQRNNSTPAGDYNQKIVDNFASNVIITNLHSDGSDVGMQGPFTNEHVGGRESRHQPLATTPVPTGEDRAEAWRLETLAGSPNRVVFTDPVGGPASLTRNNASAKLFREERAKRPVNIKNISYTTSSAVLGNYDKNYQVVSTTGRTSNNLALVQAGGEGFEQVTPENQFLFQENAISALDGKVNFALPSRALENGSFTKTVFANHFNAPGGKDVSSRGVLNPASEEFAAMNALPWRNRVVREKLKEDLRVHTGQLGTYPYQQYGLNFDGSNDYIQISPDSNSPLHDMKIAITGIEDFSISFWIRAKNSEMFGVTGNDVVIFDAATVAGSTVFQIGIEKTAGTTLGKLFFKDGNKTVTRHESSTVRVDDNQWHHYVFVYDSGASEISIYKDGIDVSPAPSTVTLGAPAASLVTIGAEYGGTGFTSFPKIDLDEFSVWNVEIPSAGAGSVSEIYNNGHPGDLKKHALTANLQAWWRMGDDISVVHDSEGSNHGQMASHQEVVTDVLRRQDSLITGSFQKANRNARWRMENGQPNDVTIKTVVYDNGFVTHPIPRADTQYSWIRDSYESSQTLGHATGSSEITFVDIGEASVVQQLNTYSNNLVYEPIFSEKILSPDDSINHGYFEDALILGNSSPAGESPATSPAPLSSYRNISLGSAVGPTATADYFNILMTARNGVAGYNTWKQTSNRQHPIVRLLAKNNYHTYMETRLDIGGSTYAGSSAKRLMSYSWPGNISTRTITNYRQRTYFVEEPAVSFNQYPMVVEFENTGENYVSAFSFLNEMETFANDVLVARANMVIKKPRAYDAFLHIFRESANGIVLRKMAMRDVVYPRTVNATLAKVRGRLQYAETAAQQRAVDAGQSRLFWRDSLNDRLKNPTLVASVDYFNSSLGVGVTLQALSPGFGLATTVDTGASSLWPLDQNEVGSGNKAGELAQDTRLSVGHDFFGTPKNAATQQYALSGTGGSGLAKAANELLWSANAQSGKKPWFDSYEEYAQDIRGFGQAYSVIPEFKISDHMDYILNNGPNATLNNFLSIEGAGTVDADLDVSAPSETDEYTAEFFKTYVHSDFMKHFGDVKQDYEDLAKPSRMALQCNVVKKLLPYQGFYPVTRCVQLGTLFSASHGRHLTGISPLASDQEKDYLAAITQPLFGPGILYNSIKAGFGYGWPIWTTQPTFVTPAGSPGPATNQKWKGDSNKYLNLISSAPDTQLRFEDLLLDKLPLNTDIYMLRRKLTGSMVMTTFYDNDYKQVAGKLRQLGSDSYVRAMHNFLAEVGNTFLEHEGVGTYKSQERLNWKPMKKGDTYYMDVAIYKTTSMIQAEGPGDLSGTPGEHARGLVYGWMGLNESAPVGTNIDKDPRFAMFTPPGFYGNSEYVTIAYTADDLDELLPPPISKIAASASLTYALDQTNTSDYAPDPISTTAGILYDNRFTVDSSLDLFNISRAQNITYDNEGGLLNTSEPDGDKDDNNVWVINTKCEFPTLNFGSSGTSSEVRGMWGQYGAFPENDEGVFFAVRESIQYATASVGANIGSLAQICGFDTTPRRIGDVASKKTISEAVVAIPFTLIKSGKNKGKKRFVRINKTTLNRQMKNKTQTGFAIPEENILDTSITSMMSSLQNYVLPPNMDFVRNKEVDPFVVYVFEFKHELNKQDLADIWQGLMPEISRNAEVDKAQLAHGLNKDEFFHGKELPSDLRWMVFKIKRKAKNNYYGAKRDSIDRGVRVEPIKSQREREFDYSYNWPHDFYSLVELAEVEAGVEFRTTKPTEGDSE